MGRTHAAQYKTPDLSGEPQSRRVFIASVKILISFA